MKNSEYPARTNVERYIHIDVKPEQKGRHDDTEMYRLLCLYQSYNDPFGQWFYKAYFHTLPDARKWLKSKINALKADKRNHLPLAVLIGGVIGFGIAVVNWYQA